MMTLCRKKCRKCGSNVWVYPATKKCPGCKAMDLVAPAKKARAVGRPRKVQEVSIGYWCIDCDKVHKHRDGAVFCRKCAARVTGVMKPSDMGCQSWGLRVGSIPRAVVNREEDKPVDRSSIYTELGGEL